MRVCDQTGDTFRRSRAPEHTQPLLDTALPLRARCDLLQPFIKNPLDRPLRHTKIARTEPLVEPPNALFPHNPLDHVPAAPQHLLRRLLMLACRQLQAGFDDPYRVRRRPGDDAGDGSGRQVDVRVFLAIVEFVGDDVFAVAVRPEIDGTSGDDAYERWTETFEECAGRFFAVNIPSRKSVSLCKERKRGGCLERLPQDVPRLDKIPQETTRSWCTDNDASTIGHEPNRDGLFAEKTRLQTCLDNVEWACHNGTAHSS